MIVLKSITADFWTSNHAWTVAREEGAPRFVTRSIGMVRYASREDALASAREKAPVDAESERVTASWIEVRHYQRGIAPRCRKPDVHQVEMFEADRVEREATP